MSRATRRGPMDEMRQLMRILTKLLTSDNGVRQVLVEDQVRRRRRRRAHMGSCMGGGVARLWPRVFVSDPALVCVGMCVGGYTRHGHGMPAAPPAASPLPCLFPPASAPGPCAPPPPAPSQRRRLPLTAAAPLPPRAQGGGNRVSEDQIKEYLRYNLGQAPMPEWGLPNGWGSYLSGGRPRRPARAQLELRALK